MLKFSNLIVFLFIQTVDTHVFSGCHLHTEKYKCLNNDFCQWCNNTDKSSNITNICRPNTKCLINNNGCEVNTKHKAVCMTIALFVNLALLFILLVSLVYISNFIRRTLDNYFHETTVGSEGIGTYVKQKALILTVVDSLLFIPPVIFWFLGNIAFLYWFMFIMCLVLILSCSETTYKTYNKKEITSQYTQIN